MKKAVFSGFVKIIVITLAICAVVFSYIFTDFSFKQTEKEMKSCLNVIGYALNYEGDIYSQIKALNSVVPEKNSRITLIDRQGHVIADTAPETDLGENHIDREEMQEALKTGEGTSLRRSSTLGRELLYCALRSEDGEYILRLALPYDGKTEFMKALGLSVAVSIVIAALVAYIIARRLSKGITKPLSELSEELLRLKNGEESFKFEGCKYDEINGIAEAAEALILRIDATIESLKAEKGKVSYILDNMSDGIIFADENSRVLNINKAALEMLGSGRKAGENIALYTHSIKIIEGVERAVKNGADSSFDIVTENKKTAAVRIKAVPEGSEAAASVLMIDVTDARESEKMRQEFFSNASHELKTPLTSIKGYSELLTGDLSFTQEQKNEFLERIKKETDNMSTLINDILMISRLENGEITEEKTEIRLKALLDEILEAEKPQISENELTVDANCDDIEVFGEYKYYYQLLSNIIGNAVKYNKKGGNVKIDICRDNEDKINITIADTGIGIPPEARGRVFERFYRVDKGRSRKIGGTGLGLAIVKHIVNYFGGEISLESKEAVGTTVKIKL